jgi:hypothetical protein
MFSVTLLVALSCSAPPQFRARAVVPPQFPVRYVVPDQAPVRPAKVCPCSELCTCGCNSGQPCQCQSRTVTVPAPGTLSVQPSVPLSLPLQTVPLYQPLSYPSVMPAPLFRSSGFSPGVFSGGGGRSASC